MVRGKEGGVSCAKCGAPEDRGDSDFCRKCGTRLLRAATPTVPDQPAVFAASGATVSRPSRTVPDQPIHAAMAGVAQNFQLPPVAAVTASAGVARLLAIRIGPPRYLAALYFMLRAVAAFLLSAVAAATLGWLRQTRGVELARSLSTTPQSVLLDLLFSFTLGVAGLLIGFLVFRLTSRGWKRPEWGKP